MTHPEFITKLQETLGDHPGDIQEFRGEWTMTLQDAESIPGLCRFAKETLQFDMLLDISSIDNYGEDPRWTLVYELYSLRNKTHLRIKCHVSEERSVAPTVTGVWRTADWHEREVFDMMGIRFEGHPDLRRILMWEGYPFHPLRKDFPLAGKASEMPDVAFSRAAPMEGGPFATTAGGKDATVREPRSKEQED